MRRYLVFAVIGSSLLVVSISSTVVTVAFPDIIRSFDTSLIFASWVLSVNQLSATCGMPLAGKACDIFGRKFIFILSVCLFTAGSLLSAIAPTIELLIFFRFIQGIGAGGFLPSATAIVADEFPNARQQSIGFFSSIFPIGQIVGPTLGGWLTEVFGWQATFWFCVPLGLIILVFALFLLRRSAHTKNRLDLAGGGIFTGAAVSIMAAISLMGNTEGAIPWPGVGLLFAASAVLLALFWRRQSRVKDPIIDIRVLREKPFIAANAFNFIYGMGVLGVFSFVPLYAVTVYGLSTLESGLVLTPKSIGMIAASLLTSFFLVRWGYRKPMIIGTAATAAVMIVMSFAFPEANILGWHLNGMAVLSLIMLASGIAVGAIAPAANNACIELMPDRIGTITGIRGMFRQVGSAISISITALVLNNLGDMRQGFYIIFIGFAVILLLSIPVIFLVPAGANAAPSGQPAKTPVRPL